MAILHESVPILIRSKFKRLRISSQGCLLLVSMDILLIIHQQRLHDTKVDSILNVIPADSVKQVDSIYNCWSDLLSFQGNPYYPHVPMPGKRRDDDDHPHPRTSSMSSSTVINPSSLIEQSTISNDHSENVKVSLNIFDLSKKHWFS